MKTLKSFDNSIYAISQTSTKIIYGGSETTKDSMEETCTGNACDTISTTSTDAGRVLETCLTIDKGRQC